MTRKNCLLPKMCIFLTLFLWSFGFCPTKGQDRASLTLDLKKARVTYEMAKNKFENDETLLNEKAISAMEYTRSKNELLGAEVEYQKLILKLLAQQSYIIVEKAIKYQTPGGAKRVKLTLRSSMEGNQDYLSQFKEHYDMFSPEMRSGKTYNIFVSLINLEDQTIIGSPYEVRIPSIGLGKSREVDFGLLKDVESLQVALNYNNKKDEKNIFLEKDASTNFIDISSSQFSQEADLGSNTSYDLVLERFSTTDDVYKLLVLNMPRQINADFLDSESGARLSQLKFNQGVNIRNLSLKVYLPENDDEKVGIDKPLVFYALAVPRSRAAELEEKVKTKLTEEDLKSLGGGKIRLELIPRGVGNLVMRAPNLYHEITAGDSVAMDITVRNEGTRRIDNIRMKMDNPMKWSTLVEPSMIKSLGPQQETKVHMVILPPSDVNVGAQEVKIKTEAYANNRRLNTEDKTVRIQVNAATSVWGTFFLILLLIGFVVGIVLFGIKISKR